MFLIEEQNCISDWWCQEHKLTKSYYAVDRNNKSSFLCSLLWVWYLLTYYCKPSDYYNITRLCRPCCVIQLRHGDTGIFLYDHFGALSDELINLWGRYYYRHNQEEMRHKRRLVTWQGCHQASKWESRDLNPGSPSPEHSSLLTL